MNDSERYAQALRGANINRHQAFEASFCSCGHEKAWHAMVGCMFVRDAVTDDLTQRYCPCMEWYIIFPHERLWVPQDIRSTFVEGRSYVSKRAGDEG